ncbi:MAG TPA: hypothetical protein VEL76_08315 [Gemmataceae bacterium]|nr:hypothetical protein [Gemmataceae bacterium]
MGFTVYYRPKPRSPLGERRGVSPPVKPHRRADAAPLAVAMATLDLVVNELREVVMFLRHEEARV